MRQSEYYWGFSNVKRKAMLGNIRNSALKEEAYFKKRQTN